MATKKTTTAAETKPAKPAKSATSAKPEEKKVEAAPKKEVEKELPRRLSLKDLEKLEASAEKLILKEDFKKVSELSDAPGLLISGFRDTQGVLRLRLKYEFDGELVINKLKTVHHL